MEQDYIISMFLNRDPQAITKTQSTCKNCGKHHGTGTSFDNYSSTEVGWCSAKLYFNENGEGKIIRFDIAPGLLYSLSMESNASEEALLTMAHELFAPAQDAANW